MSQICVDHCINRYLGKIRHRADRQHSPGRAARVLLLYVTDDKAIRGSVCDVKTASRVSTKAFLEIMYSRTINVISISNHGWYPRQLLSKHAIERTYNRKQTVMSDTEIDKRDVGNRRNWGGG